METDPLHFEEHSHCSIEHSLTPGLGVGVSSEIGVAVKVASFSHLQAWMSIMSIESIWYETSCQNLIKWRVSSLGCYWDHLKSWILSIMNDLRGKVAVYAWIWDTRRVSVIPGLSCCKHRNYSDAEEGEKDPDEWKKYLKCQSKCKNKDRDGNGQWEECALWFKCFWSKRRNISDAAAAEASPEQ